ncbi:hypothetical protein ACHHYP_03923 [Achlya hypogyna]|uniref:Uncharacterized protein n=1 Tax=Achlya hypogyna TaxID=1202772 RepID=A0A1V9Z346_ACHHY|nr:hypothetical protein ACHHYP_03923 [Achlya hypogyna]
MGNQALSVVCTQPSTRTTGALSAPSSPRREVDPLSGRIRRKRPRALLSPSLPTVAPPLVHASSIDMKEAAYDQVCEEFNLVFRPNAVLPRAAMLTLADWPASEWKIDHHEDDERGSTVCSSECSSLSDEDTNDDVSTFACTFKKPVVSAETPFLFAARSQFILTDYICPCGKCPWYEAIERHVQQTSHLSSRAKRSVTRMLQAYSTYNEATGFAGGMLRVAEACWTQCQGNEDEAFEAFVDCYESEYANEWL